MPTVKELRDKRAKALADARAIDNRATKEKRSMTAEEREQFLKLSGEVRTLKGEIDDLSAEEEARSSLAIAEADLEEVDAPVAGRDDPDERGGDDDDDGGPARRGDRGNDRERRGRGEPRGAGRNAGNRPQTIAYRMASGKTRSIQIAGQRASEEYREAYGRWLRSGRTDKVLIQYGRTRSEEDEERDLVVENDTQAGYLIAPQQMAAGMIRAVDDNVVIRQYATVMPLTQAKSLGAISLDADPEDGEWTPECKTGSADSSMKFGKRQLNPSRLSKKILLSNELLRMAPDVEALVNERLGYKMGVTQEKNFLLGDGAEKPLGLMVASNDGIPTSRDLSTSNTATEIKPDNLIRVKQNLKAQYRSRAVWLFHTDAITQLMLLKDANGQYMWRQGLTGGDPDTLLNRPVLESGFMPNTFTSGKYVGLFGDLSYYWIAESLAMRFQRSIEKYIEEDKTLIIVRAMLDGMPVLAEAFTRIKLG